MSISEIAIKRPVFTTMLTVGLVVLGLMGMSRLGTDLFPDVKFPLVMVAVPYPGAAPEDVERQVVKKVEDAVVSINKIERIDAYARENVGVVVVVFELDADLDKSAAEVREKIAAIERDLPDGSEKPIISKVDVGASPVLIYAAAAPRPAEEVRALTADLVKPALEQVDGVARVDVLGGLEREIQVDLDAVKLEAFRLSPLAVIQKLKAENATIPAGHYSAGKDEIGVRTVGEFRSVTDIEQAILFAGPDGRRVRVEDVGKVVDGFKEQRTIIRSNAQDAVAFQVVKTSGANTVTVTDSVKAALAKLHGTLPADFHTALLVDQSSFIKENSHEVETAILFGGAMAILVILFFMMDLRSTFISALALPTAVIGTFLMMYAFGFTLNMMTLLALSLAIGLLIDDAVVVRENIFRHLEMGEEPEVAAAKGTSEIALAVLATTMTIVAVFVPVAFMSGIVGQFFRQFGLTVTAAVLLSMVVAFTLDPMLSARLAKRILRGAEKEKQDALEAGRLSGKIKTRLAAMFVRIDELYRKTLVWTVGRPKTVVFSALALFVASVGLASGLGNEFMAAEDRGQFLLNLEYPAQSSLAETSARSLELEKKLLADPRFQTVYATVGPEGEVNKAKYRVNVGPKDSRKDGVQALKDVAKSMASAPDVKVIGEDPPIVEGLGGGSWFPIMVSISGPSYDVLVPTAEKVAEALRATPGSSDVAIDYAPGKREMRVDVDRGVAGQLGLPIAIAGLSVRAGMEGEVAGRLRGKATSATGNEDDETDIRVRLAAADRANPEALARLPLPTAGGVVRLGDVAKIVEGTGNSVIQRQDRTRRILVTGATRGRPLGAVVADFEPKVAALVPAGYDITWLGSVKDMKDSNASFGLALGVAILFIYIVLASQFESFVHPATIMLSLPLALVGAMTGLWIYGSAITLGAQIGIILLMGLVTKNAILLVDSALVFQREGMSARDAILAAGPRRLRPILMTSAAMVLGMLPTALGRGSGSEFRAPMAIAVVGGVISSTFLTLLVVPVVYLGVERVRVWLAARLAGLRARAGGEAAGQAPKIQPGTVMGALVIAAILGALAWVAFPTRASAAEPAVPAASAAGRTLTLEEAMQLADESNPDLAVAAEKVAQASADLRSAWANFLPQVKAQGSYLWYDREIEFEPAPGVLAPIVLQESPTYQGQIQGTLPLFNPQGFPTLAAAKHGKRATVASVEAGRQELFLGVAQLYWTIVVSDRLIVAADEAVANAAELTRVSNEQFKAQVATQLALARAKAAEAQATQFAISARGRRTATEAALARLTGVEGPIKVVAPAPVAATAQGQDAAALWEIARTRRPDLKSADEAVKARAALRRGGMASSYLPVIAGQGTWFYTSNEGLTGRNDGGTLGVVASWNLLDGGYREAKNARASSEWREAVASRESTNRKAREEITRAALELTTANASLEAAREAATFARQAQSLAQTQYRAGTATNLEVSQANATLVQAEAGFAQAEATAAIAALFIKKATGESLR